MGKRPFARPAGYQLTNEDHARIQPKLFAKIRQLGFSGEDAEDLVQETFLLAQRSLCQGGFQGQSNLDTWIVGIGKNRCLKAWQARGAIKRTAHEVPLDRPRNEHGPAANEPIDDKAGPEEQVGDRQLLDLVLRAMCHLPAKIRAPLVLFARGHSYQQIASLLRISPDLVTSRVQQARAKLRKAIPRPPRGSPR